MNKLTLIQQFNQPLVFDFQAIEDFKQYSAWVRKYLNDDLKARTNHALQMLFASMQEHNVDIIHNGYELFVETGSGDFTDQNGVAVHWDQYLALVFSFGDKTKYNLIYCVNAAGQVDQVVFLTPETDVEERMVARN